MYRRLTQAAFVGAALFALALTGCDSADLTGVTADGRGNDKGNRGGSESTTSATSAFDSDASDGVVDLIAGQNTKVGTVSWVNEANGDVTVTYQTLAGYCMTEWHLDAGTVSGSGTNKNDFAGIKVTGGGAVPGQMDYKAEGLDPCLKTVTQVLESELFIGGGERIIAAHAVVVDDADGSCNYFYGISADGNIYQISLDIAGGTVTETQFFYTGFDQTAYRDNWPNSLAYDASTSRLYYSNALSPTDGPLYFYDLVADTGNNFSGHLFRRSASGTASPDGAFWYVSQNLSDNLRKVTFDASGAVVTDEVVCELFTGGGGDVPMVYGDLLYEDGIIYGSAEIGGAVGGGINDATFFTIDPSMCDGPGGADDSVAYTEIQTGTNNNPLYLLQLATDCDGTMVGYDNATKTYYTVDRATGDQTPVASSDLKINDLSPGPCDCPGEFDETAWGLGSEFPGANWSTYIRIDS